MKIFIKDKRFIVSTIILAFGVIAFVGMGLFGLFISVAGILGYCEMNNRHNGQFVLSNIFLNNSLAHISYSGAYKYGGDDEFIAIIDATRHLGYYTAPFIINNDVVDKYMNYYKKFPQYLPPTDDMLFCMNIPDGKKYPPERIKRFIRNSQFTEVYGTYMLGRMIDIIFAYGTLFILFLLQSAIIICAFVKYKKIYEDDLSIVYKL